MPAPENCKPGDVLPDGRIVDEVDEKGRPTVVHRERAAAPPASPPIPKPQPKKKRTPRKPAPAVNAAAVAEKAAATAKKEKPVTQKKKTAAAPKKKAVAQKKKAASKKKATPSKKTSTKKATSKKAPPKKATRTMNRWTDEAKDAVRDRIANGGETYASIASEFGITPQTLWANLNRRK